MAREWTAAFNFRFVPFDSVLKLTQLLILFMELKF